MGLLYHLCGVLYMNRSYVKHLHYYARHCFQLKVAEWKILIVCHICLHLENITTVKSFGSNLR